MNKYSWWRFWPRYLLWWQVIGIIGFYLTIWLRTAPDKKDRVVPLPARKSASRDASVAAGVASPLVSIIVPARNEERNIRRCVQSLLEQDYDNYEVVAVDDASTDGTGTILDELACTHPNGKRLWILRLRDLPQGWAGKPHAIHRGVQEARGQWLLFTDADTWHAPNALRSAMTQAMAECIDMFTLSATQVLPTFWDKVLMPLAYFGISMLYPPRLVNNPGSSLAIANGQYILIRREVYDLIGGYARSGLRDTLLDDRDLAHVVKEQGFKLRFLSGSNLVHVHMYHGLADIWRGWRKNAYLGNRGGWPFVLLQLIGLPAVTILPFLLPLFAPLTRKRQEGRISSREANVATAAALTPLLLYRCWLNRQLQVPWYYAFTHPLAGAIFDGILSQSMWRIITGKGVDWRGRQYHNSKPQQLEDVTVRT